LHDHTKDALIIIAWGIDKHSALILGKYKACRSSENKKKWVIYFTSSCWLPPLPSADSSDTVRMRMMRHGGDANLGFPKFASTCVPLVGTGVAERSVGLELAFCIGDFAGCFVRDGFGERECRPCCLGGESVAL
jgi:hypothetical protein